MKDFNSSSIFASSFFRPVLTNCQLHEYIHVFIHGQTSQSHILLLHGRILGTAIRDTAWHVQRRSRHSVCSVVGTVLRHPTAGGMGR